MNEARFLVWWPALLAVLLLWLLPLAVPQWQWMVASAVLVPLFFFMVCRMQAQLLRRLEKLEEAQRGRAFADTGA